MAADFADPAADPGERCDLLAPATLAALEEDESAAVRGGDRGGAAGRRRGGGRWRSGAGTRRSRLADDTLFLTETDAGWRVTAAACESRAEAPYDCEVEGP